MSRLRPGRRIFAILAILLVLAAAASDLFIAGFWLSHPMLTAIVSALVVVVLSVAVIEVVLSRRSERRWRVLAQTALLELAEAANTTWSALADVLELPGASAMPPGRVRWKSPGRVLGAGWGGGGRVVRRQPHRDHQHRRRPRGRNLGPGAASPASTVVGSPHRRARRCHPGEPALAGCRPLIRIA